MEDNRDQYSTAGKWTEYLPLLHYTALWTEEVSSSGCPGSQDVQFSPRGCVLKRAALFYGQGGQLAKAPASGAAALWGWGYVPQCYNSSLFFSTKALKPIEKYILELINRPTWSHDTCAYAKTYGLISPLLSSLANLSACHVGITSYRK